MLGYPESVKGYRLWVLGGPSIKIINSRDIIFNESEMPCLKQSSKGTNESVNNQPVQSEVKLTKFNPSQPEDDENEVVHHQVEQTTEPVEPNEPHNGAEPKEPDHITEQTEVQDYQLTRDRVRRQPRPNPRYELLNMTDFALVSREEIEQAEPTSYEEAIHGKNSENWLRAMKEEMQSLNENKTWKLVKKPKDQRVVQCKWVYKLKEGNDSTDPVRFKARLAAKGYTQIEGVDYNEIFSLVNEIFSLVIKYKIIRLILVMVAQYNWELEKLDVKTAFLLGELKEDIFMSQPQGFEVKNKIEYVCKLEKSLYGLKQSPRQWYKRFDAYVLKIGFKRSEFDACLYYNNMKSGGEIYFLLYIDDMLLASPDKSQIYRLKNLLKSEFDMKDLGYAKKILGMVIKRIRSENKLTITQEAYLNKVVTKFGMKDSKTVNVPLTAHMNLSKTNSPKSEEEMKEMENIPYANAISSVMFSMITTRPDLAYAISFLSRFMSNPGKPHWAGMKWLLRYIVGTLNLGLVYEKDLKI